MCSDIHKRESLPSSGAVTSYIHPGGNIGVLLEVSCESDLIARSDDFQKLIHDIAMQIAASGANFIRKEHVPAEVLRRELDIYRSQAAATGKPSPVVAKIVEGKLGKFYEEVCLYEQSFIKDQTLSISQLIASAASNLREKIAVRRFVRFKVGENNAAVAINEDWRTEGGEASGVTANKPKVPKAGSGFAAAKLDSDVE